MSEARGFEKSVNMNHEGWTSASEKVKANYIEQQLSFEDHQELYLFRGVKNIDMPAIFGKDESKTPKTLAAWVSEVKTPGSSHFLFSHVSPTCDGVTAFWYYPAMKSEVMAWVRTCKSEMLSDIEDSLPPLLAEKHRKIILGNIFSDTEEIAARRDEQRPNGRFVTRILDQKEHYARASEQFSVASKEEIAARKAKQARIKAAQRSNRTNNVQAGSLRRKPPTPKRRDGGAHLQVRKPPLPQTQQGTFGGKEHAVTGLMTTELENPKMSYRAAVTGVNEPPTTAEPGASAAEPRPKTGTSASSEWVTQTNTKSKQARLKKSRSKTSKGPVYVRGISGTTRPTEGLHTVTELDGDELEEELVESDGEQSDLTNDDSLQSTYSQADMDEKIREIENLNRRHADNKAMYERENAATAIQLAQEEERHEETKAGMVAMETRFLETNANVSKLEKQLKELMLHLQDRPDRNEEREARAAEGVTENLMEQPPTTPRRDAAAKRETTADETQSPSNSASAPKKAKQSSTPTRLDISFARTQNAQKESITDGPSGYSPLSPRQGEGASNS